jgi:hypothetical protein
VAGMKLPNHPVKNNSPLKEDGIRFQALKAKGINTMPDVSIRREATCHGFNKALPSGLNMPNFINTNELPQIRQRSIKRSHCFCLGVINIFLELSKDLFIHLYIIYLRFNY